MGVDCSVDAAAFCWAARLFLFFSGVCEMFVRCRVDGLCGKGRHFASLRRGCGVLVQWLIAVMH